VVPTLGEIVFALQADRMAVREGGPRTRLVGSYDNQFAHRPDFALWRREFGTENPTPRSKAFPRTEVLLEAGLSELAQHDPAVVWGVLSLGVGLATSERGTHLFNGDREHLVCLLERAAFNSRLAPLPNAYAGCAIQRLLTLDAINKVRFEARHLALPLDQLTDYLDTVERLIKEFDPRWLPGRCVSLHALNRNPRERPVGALGIFKLSLRLVSFIFRVRGTVRDGVKRLDVRQAKVRQLLIRAAQFAFSSWRSARSSRLFIEAHLEGLRNSNERGTGQMGAGDETQTFHEARSVGEVQKAQNELAIAERNECMSLVRASQAAKDAGFLSSGAKLAFWALCTIPDELLGDPDFVDLGSDLGYDIRQFGLEPDHRFARKRRSRFGQGGGTPDNEDRVAVNDSDEFKEAKPPGEVIGIGASAPALNVSPPEVTPGPARRRSQLVLDPEDALDPFKARIVADQQDVSDWRSVLAKYPAKPENPMDPIGRVIYDANGGHLDDPALAQAAFNLCANRYRLPAASASLIKHFKPGKSDVMALIALMERATRAIPVGIDQHAQRQWQNTLRSVWLKMCQGARIYEEDVLLAHEVLLGRGVTVFRGSPNATTFARRFFGQFADDDDDEKSRDLLGSDFSLLRRADIGVPSDALKSRVEALIRGLAGQVAFASLVSLTPTKWSLLLVGGNGIWHYDVIDIGRNDALNEGAEVMSDKAWGTPWFQPWWGNTPGLNDLAKALGQVIKDKYPSARYLELAVEPQLAPLPWNDLVRPIWRRLGIQPVVALIPNLTWPLVAQAPFNSSGVKLFLADEQVLTSHLDESLDQATTRKVFLATREGIARTKRVLEENYTSAAFVLGLGTWNEERKVAVILGPTGPIELAHEARTDLLDLGEYRAVVTYACHGGHVAKHFLGDLSGIPGVCLSLKTRLFVGAVAEVLPKTVSVLHKHFADPHGPREIGLRYAAALNEDRSVARFNLFGFANEPARLDVPRVKP